MFSKVGILAGVVLLALGAAVATGAIPVGASVTCTGQCTVASVGFTYTASNLTLTVTDTSSAHLPPGYTPLSLVLSLSWGDGSGLPNIPLGTTHSHTYATARTYTVSETLVVAAVGSSWTATAVTSVTLTQGGGGGGGGESVSASFGWSASGLNVTLHDTTATTGSPTISSVELSWGDGSGAREAALGFTATHSFVAAGTYNVSETVNWVMNGSAESSVYSTTLSVSSGGGGNGGGGGGGAASPFSWSFLSGLLLIGGGATLVASFTAPDPRLLAAAAGSGLAIGGVVGWGLGGFKLL